MSEPQRPPFPQQHSTGPGGIPGMTGTPNLIDELQSEVAGEAAPLLTFVVTHIKAIVAFFVLLIAVITGYGLWQWQAEKTYQEAQSELGRILIMKNDPTKLAVLEAFRNKAPKALQNGVLAEMAMTAARMGEIQKAAEFYGLLYAADPQGSAGMLAALNQAELLQQLKKFPDALEILNKVQPGVPEVLKFFVQEKIAFTLEQSGQAKEALAHYEALSRQESIVKNNGASDFYQYKINQLKKQLADK